MTATLQQYGQQPAPQAASQQKPPQAASQRNPPQPTPTLFGFDRITVVTVLVVPLILTIFSVWLTKKWRDKLRVRVVSKLSDKQFEQLSALYCERVPDYERVPPNHFRAFFRREHSAHSVSDFKRRVKTATTPIHLLLIARNASGICGFLKAIYIPEIRCLFLAYVVTAPEERMAAQKLMSELYAACRGSSIQSIVYEICVDPESTYKAHNKAQAALFRHYGATFGLKFHRIGAKYQQPEVCSFNVGECPVTNAELYIGYLGERSQKALDSMGRDDYMKLVSSIYKYVYLMSYANAEPELAERYKDYLSQVTRTLFAHVKARKIDLK